MEGHRFLGFADLISEYRREFRFRLKRVDSAPSDFYIDLSITVLYICHGKSSAV